jgi:hypothetical protein
LLVGVGGYLHLVDDESQDFNALCPGVLATGGHAVDGVPGALEEVAIVDDPVVGAGDQLPGEFIQDAPLPAAALEGGHPAVEAPGVEPADLAVVRLEAEASKLVGGELLSGDTVEDAPHLSSAGEERALEGISLDLIELDGHEDLPLGVLRSMKIPIPDRNQRSRTTAGVDGQGRRGGRWLWLRRRGIRRLRREALGVSLPSRGFLGGTGAASAGQDHRPGQERGGQEEKQTKGRRAAQCFGGHARETVSRWLAKRETEGASLIVGFPWCRAAGWGRYGCRRRGRRGEMG